jgi:PAS domain S-box-containing protein
MMSGLMTQSLLTRPDRLAALRQTGLLDTPPEEGFDRHTRLAARLLGASTSLIALVAEDRQFFKSALGLPEPWASNRTAPLSFSFCSTVVATGEPLVVEDARRHPLLSHSPAIRELGWVAYAGVPLVTREGHVVGSFCVVDKTPRLWSERDMALLQDLAASVVTEIELRREIVRRRQAELGRRDSEEEFHNTFEEAGIGMALISLDGRWLRINRTLCEILGAAPQDLIGLPAEALTHPDDAAADREAIRLLLAGECRTYTMEKRYLGPSGETVWGLVSVSLATGPEGRPAHLIAAVQDITERKEAEAALREREERYRLLAQAYKEAVREWDLATDELTWDDATGPLLDYPQTDLGSNVDWWYERIHPEDRERVVASIDAAIAEGESNWWDEYRFRRADGTHALVQDGASIVRDEAGGPVRVIGAMAESPAPQRVAGPEPSQLLEALPQGAWLFDRQGSLVQANAASRQIWGDSPEGFAEHVAPALRGESIRHQEVLIRSADGVEKTILLSSSPIRDQNGEVTGALVLGEDITERKAAEAAQAQQEEHLRQSQKMEAVGRLAGGIAHDFNNLLTGILSYSDLILQELRPADPIRADVEQIRDAGQRAAGVTRQLLAFSRRQLLQPRVVSLNTMVNELEPMFGRLLGGAVTLETQLDPELGNVLVDPVHLEQALVNLVLNAREAMPQGGQLRLTTANVEQNVAITISDTGVGMDETTQARIFEPFFTTKRGRGLGLATVYGTVEQSGGYIAVQSTPGQGASFTIYLPRYWGSEPAIGASIQRMPEVGTETLLLVEDEAAVRASVRRLLEWHGYTVLEAGNGADALRVYEENQNGIDLVLTDIGMPEMGGHELIERLRARRPDLRVLFMSGHADRVFTRNGAMPQGTGFVEKPFTVETLMRRLREVLDG